MDEFESDREKLALEKFNAQMDKPGMTDTIRDSFIKAFHPEIASNPVAKVFQMTELGIAKLQGDKISPEELNNSKRLSYPIKSPMSQAAFDLIVKRDNIRKNIESSLNKDTEGSFLRNAVSFGVGLAPEILDPINYAAGFGISKGINRVLGNLVTSQSPEVFSAIKNTIRPFNTEIGDAITGNIAADIATVIPSDIQEQKDIDIFQNLINDIAAGTIMPLAIKGIGKTFDAIKGSPDATNKVSKSIQYLEEQMQKDKKPDADTLLDSDKVNQDYHNYQNSIESDVGHSLEEAKELETLNSRPEITHDEAIDSFHDESLKEIEALKANEELTDEDLLELEGFEVVNPDDIDMAMKDSQVCVRKS